MIDISSKGLLPQLTDVLHALTDSHELLLDKLQSVRLEHRSVVLRDTEASLHAEFLGFVDWSLPSPVDLKTAMATDSHRAIRFDEIESGTGSTRLAPPESHVSSGVTAASAHITYAGTTARTSTEVVTPRHARDAEAQAHASTPHERPPAVRADPTSGESASRSYNFFDELDAKLAHLENPESGPGQR